MHDSDDVIVLEDGCYRLRSSDPRVIDMLTQYRHLNEHLTHLQQRLAMAQTARASYLTSLRRELASQRFFWLSLGALGQAQWSTPRRLVWPSDEPRPGDRLVVYINGKGAAGVAEVTESGYRWCNRARCLEQAIGAGELRQEFGVSHPTRPLVRLDTERARRLCDAMMQRW